MNKDKALQVIRSNYPTGRNQLCEALETLIPELKESEDERIRKALIHLISEQDGYLTAITGISVINILAWLEKQGEQKPTEWSDRDWYYYSKLESFLEVKDHYSPTESSSGYQKDVHETLIWLKSLKERYTWKPSDEQMEALLKLEEMHVLEHEKTQENAHLYMVIKNIREQLQKLRKE